MDINTIYEPHIGVPYLTKLDLVNEKVGGKVLFSTDDFFAEKENLIKDAKPIFIHDKYTEFGKWMDGWESRRKRVEGHDYAIVEMGIPGMIEGLNINTAFFTGNHPEYAQVEALEASKGTSTSKLENMKWTVILKKAKLQGGTENFFPVESKKRFTHIRLRIYPDGGVARFRVYGKALPDTKNLKGTIDLVSVVNGGEVITANDFYFGPKDNLILPGRAKNMGGGWETRRKRGPGFDWIVVKFCGKGKIKKIEVDTNHYKGNFPDRCSIDVAYIPGADLLPCDLRDRKDISWVELLAETKLSASKQHYFEKELNASVLKGSYNYIRLNIYPDGGISRLRVNGVLVK